MKTIKKLRPTQRRIPKESFRVWIRPLGFAWKIHAEGWTQAIWLKQQLVAHNAVCTEIRHAGSRRTLAFRCLSENEHQRDAIERLLHSLPQARIQIEPA